MSALAVEWRQRDKERELLVKKKLGEYQTLEEQLKRTLADLEKRDKQLSGNEQEVGIRVISEIDHLFRFILHTEGSVQYS